MRDGVPSTPLGAVRVSPAAELLRVGDNVAPRAIDPSSRTPAASSRTSTRRWQRVCVCFCLSLCLSLCLCVLAHNKRFLFRASHRRRPVANCLPRRPFTRFLIHCFSLSLTNSQMAPGKIACRRAPREFVCRGAESRDESSAQHAEGSSSQTQELTESRKGEERTLLVVATTGELRYLSVTQAKSVWDRIGRNRNRVKGELVEEPERS